MDAVIVTGAAGAPGHAVVAEFRATGREVVARERLAAPIGGAAVLGYGDA